MKPLWLRDLDREKVRGLREVLSIVSGIVAPEVVRDIQRNIRNHRNPNVIHNGGKP